MQDLASMPRGSVIKVRLVTYRHKGSGDVFMQGQAWLPNEVTIVRRFHQRWSWEACLGSILNELVGTSEIEPATLLLAEHGVSLYVREEDINFREYRALLRAEATLVSLPTTVATGPLGVADSSVITTR